VNEITATGGIMIMAIAINLLELKRIRVANMLPALIVVSLGVPFVENWPHIQKWIENLL